ncbi:RNA polymerase sigma factor YlaC [Parvicella tangerina]|uniref:RNA polymerase sigma factor YlaC n=1 Tax=Parvicella tangerina TaxID=2829795 RepID=A0A916JMI8_9FLAO|nr:RNA polymerase sigma factor YlaC [Parvicella tangerina]
MSDEELMRLFQKKNHQKAITELYARYADRLLGYFIKMLYGDESKAQDFLQDLFVKVIEKKHLFNPEKRFYTWVFTIASNMCKTSFRKGIMTEVNDSHSLLLKISTEDQPSLNRKAFRKLLRKEIHLLEHHHKVVFILRHLENFSLLEIAEITDTSIGTVKSRLFYATKIISKQLKQYSPDHWQDTFKIS